MNKLFLTAALILTASNACAAELTGTASAELPVRATIINLATMPIEDAVAFCKDRNMACPAIYGRYEASRERGAVQVTAASGTDDAAQYATRHFIME